MKRTILTILTIVLLAGCTTDADTARNNLDLAAEQFEVDRRIVFINGITDQYLLEVVGKCSYESESTQVVVICKTGPEEFWKHSMVRSDNVTVVVEQLSAEAVSGFRHRVIFKPEALLPDIDVETQAEQNAEAEQDAEVGQ